LAWTVAELIATIAYYSFSVAQRERRDPANPTPTAAESTFHQAKRLGRAVALFFQVVFNANETRLHYGVKCCTMALLAKCVPARDS